MAIDQNIQSARGGRQQHHPPKCRDFSQAGGARSAAGRRWLRCLGQSQRLSAAADFLRHPDAQARRLPDLRHHQTQRPFCRYPGGHAVVQRRCVRQGTRAHGRLPGISHQTVHQRPALASCPAVWSEDCPFPTRSDVMPIQKVLVVDDSKTELMFLTDLLQKKGIQVRTAENAEEAFRRLAEEKPDLILMDVVMPGQNGFQLTRAITRDPQYADVPIIMCTSKNQETDRVWGMRQGARGYITKPVDPAELQAKIDALG